MHNPLHVYVLSDQSTKKIKDYPKERKEILLSMNLTHNPVTLISPIYIYTHNKQNTTSLKDSPIQPI
jgi:hypothetical protein